MKEKILIAIIVVLVMFGLYKYAQAQSANIVAVQSISNTCDNEILNDAGGDLLGPYNNSILSGRLPLDETKMERDQEAVAQDRSRIQAELIGLQGIAACETTLNSQTNAT